MHDEQIDELSMENGEFILHFSNLHFEHEGEKYACADIVFRGFDDLMSDIFYGYKTVLITGKIINPDNTYGDQYNLTISAHEIVYRFIAI